MKKTRILYISYDSAFEPIPQSQVIPYLKELAKDGYLFHWLSFDKNTLRNLRDKRQSLKCELAQHNIFWHSLAYYRRPYVFAKAFNIFCGIIASAFYVLLNRISLIHCRSEVASVIGMAVCIPLKRKLIYDRRGFMAEDYVEGGMWEGRDSFLYRLLIFVDKKLLSYSSRIVVLTHKMQDWLLTHRPQANGKIAVIPCCVDLSRFSAINNKKAKAELGFGGKFLFVYSGSLGTWYLLETMIDFFLTAKMRIPNAHFLILTMSNGRIVDKIIKTRKIDAGNFSVKHASYSEVPKFIRCADSSLCFIKPVISKLASSPTKLAEFLACGVPVIINSGIGDCDEILETGESGVIVKGFTGNDYRQAVEKLLLLLSDKEGLKKRCVESAQKYFSLTDGVARYKKIYQTLS